MFESTDITYIRSHFLYLAILTFICGFYKIWMSVFKLFMLLPLILISKCSSNEEVDEEEIEKWIISYDFPSSIEDIVDNFENHQPGMRVAQEYERDL